MPLAREVLPPTPSGMIRGFSINTLGLIEIPASEHTLLGKNSQINSVSMTFMGTSFLGFRIAIIRIITVRQPTALHGSQAETVVNRRREVAHGLIRPVTSGLLTACRYMLIHGSTVVASA